MNNLSPDAPAVSCLLGKHHRANGDIQSAANSFVATLEVDAFMWDAFTNSCDCGLLHPSICTINFDFDFG